jgi:hypothetical protein
MHPFGPDLLVALLPCRTFETPADYVTNSKLGLGHLSLLHIQLQQGRVIVATCSLLRTERWGIEL